MLETLKMWVFGLPYALYQTQRVKVAVQRFWDGMPHYNWGELDIGDLSACGGDLTLTDLSNTPGWNIEPGDDHTWN